ncbi:hypothetical protein OJF2_04660 [Aquisphaera giovannonii]|uniref:Uncharacterized protein n=1 Tax=Aquisphaera giovannonii TaxID=406548 RepID=A0A5B9VVN4_9BACT|nr:DUF6768 family protein [Aquisphaera giovannonii]QEH31997.1 hypothetical protein OJF2_04660 [Aquisphaera giovannonii]
MKPHDRDFDDLLSEALSREEAEVFRRLGKPSVFHLVTDTFRGTMRWLNILGYAVTIVVFGLGIVCLVGLLGTDRPPMMLRWGLGFGTCVLTVMALKVWFWMEMQRHSLLREIKRVELQVAHLGAQLRDARLVPGPHADESGRGPS